MFGSLTATGVFAYVERSRTEVANQKYDKNSYSDQGKICLFHYKVKGKYGAKLYFPFGLRLCTKVEGLFSFMRFGEMKSNCEIEKKDAEIEKPPPTV